MAAPILKNRVGHACTTPGTGTVTLGSALGAVAINQASWQTAATAGVTNGQVVRYLILDSNGNWEYGTGTYTSSGTTLSRTVGGSSAGGTTPITLSASSQVFIAAIGEDIVPYDSVTGTVTATLGVLTGSANANLLLGSGYSLTGADTHALLDLSGTWNTSGAPTGIKLAITNTAAGTSSRLIDLTAGNIEFAVTGNAEDATYGQGIILKSDSTIGTVFNIQCSSASSHNFQFFSTGSANGPGHFGVYDSSARAGLGYTLLDLNGTNAVMSVPGVSVVGWTVDASFAGGTLDTGFAKNAAGVVEVNNGTAGTFRDMKMRNLNMQAGTVTLAAGTTAISPQTYTSGTNLTTAAAGACEFDGTAFYHTSVASARQVVTTEQVQVLSANRTFTNNTSAQAIFNATTNGAVTLAATTTYEFEMMVAASGFSSSAHTINLTFATSGSFTSVSYFFDAQTSSTLATPLATLSGFIAVATASAVIASSTTTGLILRVRGTIRMNAGGTVTPQMTQVTASAAAVVQAGSFFRCWPIGSNTVTNVGNWS